MSDILQQCLLCKKVKTPAGYIAIPEEELAGKRVSHGYCPYCKLVFLIQLAIEEKNYVPELIEMVRHQCTDIIEVKLMMFIAELTNDGFVLKFDNGMELGLRVFMGSMFYHARDQYGRYSGMANDQKKAREIYELIVDRLLALPPKP